MRRLAVVVGAAALLANLLVVVGPAGVASANDVLAPTTADDVSDPGDQLLSLREAVAVANQTAGADTIVLAADEEYVLDDGCGEFGVPSPALRLDDAAGVTVVGNGATVTGAGTPSDGCDRHVFTNAGGLLTLRDLTLRGGHGDAYCSLSAGGCPFVDQRSGGAVYSTGPLALEAVHVVDNQADGAGGGLYGTSTITATDSTIEGNVAPLGGGIYATDEVTLVRTTVSDNHAIQWSDLFGLAMPGEGGGVMAPSIVVEQSLVAGNVAEGSNMSGWCIGGRGGGLRGISVDVSSSTIADNVAEDGPGDCADAIGYPLGLGGGILVSPISNQNAITSLTLEHATVTGNVGDPAALWADQAVELTASAIGESPGSSLCAFRDAVTSGGHNVIGGSCGFPYRRTDRWHVPTLGLGPLADHGGPTQTRLPNTGGPLSLIPTADCGTDPDQRGGPRPQGACEVGAVEVPGPTDPVASPPNFPPHPFLDVPPHADVAVDWAVANGVITDRADHLFGPGDVLPRSAVALYLWRFMGSPPLRTTARLPYRDVPVTAPYRRAVRWAYQEGLFTNVHIRQGRYLDPGKRVTNYQFVNMLWRLADPFSVYPFQPFTSVPSGVTRAPMDWAAYWNLLPGGAATFHPKDPLLRDFLTTTLHRAASNPDAWKLPPTPTNDF